MLPQFLRPRGGYILQTQQTSPGQRQKLLLQRPASVGHLSQVDAQQLQQLQLQQPPLWEPRQQLQQQQLVRQQQQQQKHELERVTSAVQQRRQDFPAWPWKSSRGVVNSWTESEADVSEKQHKNIASSSNSSIGKEAAADGRIDEDAYEACCNKLWAVSPADLFSLDITAACQGSTGSLQRAAAAAAVAVQQERRQAAFGSAMKQLLDAENEAQQMCKSPKTGRPSAADKS
ncbi:unnamed protein product [Rangifer tarandus platyrhynchus]|uniref:Uncharacterized protein n=1 Tax=Rangifer tarandus platyrhynchus TaxID=3082113 RepID=A0ABN8XM75_RANTA|nr:unnamed protein product [Rangifer tarandus platyrhynchus]